MRSFVLVVALGLASVEGAARLSSPIVRSALRPHARTVRVAMADVLTRPPSVQLAPTKPSSDQQNAKGKKYKLLLFNDAVNKREFVARVLTSVIPDMTEPTAVRNPAPPRVVRSPIMDANGLVCTPARNALGMRDAQYTVMQKAHTAGFAVCGVWMFELAEAYCDGLTVRARGRPRRSHVRAHLIRTPRCAPNPTYPFMRAVARSHGGGHGGVRRLTFFNGTDTDDSAVVPRPRWCGQAVRPPAHPGQSPRRTRPSASARPCRHAPRRRAPPPCCEPSGWRRGTCVAS